MKIWVKVYANQARARKAFEDYVDFTPLTKGDSVNSGRLRVLHADKNLEILFISCEFPHMLKGLQIDRIFIGDDVTTRF